MLPDFVLVVSCALPLLGLVVFVFAVWHVIREHRNARDSEPRCIRCGYRLRGLTTNVCPECGTHFDVAVSEAGSACPTHDAWPGLPASAADFNSGACPGPGMLDCTIYWGCDDSFDDAAQRLRRISNSPPQSLRTNYITDWCEMTLRRNEGRIETWRTQSDAFELFPYYIDVFATVDNAAFVARLREFIALLRRSGDLVVPACDFEADLQ